MPSPRASRARAPAPPAARAIRPARASCRACAVPRRRRANRSRRSARARMLDERAKPRDVVAANVPDAEPRRRRCRARRTPSIRSRVPPCAGCASTARPPAAMDQPIASAMPSRSLATYAGRPLAEVPVERVAEVDCPTSRRSSRAPRADARSRRPPPARARRPSRSARRARSAARTISRGAVAPHLAKHDERALQLARCREMCSPRMCVSDVALDGAQLDAGDDAHAQALARLARLRHAVDRVVIGQRDRREADALALAATTAGGRTPIHPTPSNACGDRRMRACRPRRSAHASSPLRATCRSAASARTVARGPRRPARRASVRATARPTANSA